jgi:imidazolonepropionase-like amidohydrolase
MAPALRLDAGLLWRGPGRLERDASVVVEGERIAWVGPRAQAPDVEPLRELPFLMPGVVDRHVHIGLSDPPAVLAGGVTRVRDLGWIPGEIHALAERSRAADFDGPRVDACGPMLTAPGGYPTDRAWAPAGIALELAGATTVRAAVERVLDEGAIAVKLVLHPDAGPTLSDEELAAACDAAHDRGRQATAHVEGREQAERALRAGVDELAHAPWSERLDDALVRALARRCAIVSTLDIHAHGDDDAALGVALDNLARFHAAGGRVRYGTDLGNAGIPAGVHVAELRHLARAGLAPDELLTSMTPGRLVAGMAADLVGLAADPFADLDAFGAVALVVRAGRRRAHVDAASAPA